MGDTRHVDYSQRASAGAVPSRHTRLKCALWNTFHHIYTNVRLWQCVLHVQDSPLVRLPVDHLEFTHEELIHRERGPLCFSRKLSALLKPEIQLTCTE